MQLCGAVLTALGVVVIATGGAPRSLLEIGLNTGDLAMLAACVLYAGYTVALRDRPPMSDAAFFTLLGLAAAATGTCFVETATPRDGS